MKILKTIRQMILTIKTALTNVINKFKTHDVVVEEINDDDICPNDYAIYDVKPEEPKPEPVDPEWVAVDEIEITIDDLNHIHTENPDAHTYYNDFPEKEWDRSKESTLTVCEDIECEAYEYVVPIEYGILMEDEWRVIDIVDNVITMPIWFESILHYNGFIYDLRQRVTTFLITDGYEWYNTHNFSELFILDRNRKYRQKRERDERRRQRRLAEMREREEREEKERQAREQKEKEEREERERKELEERDGEPGYNELGKMTEERHERNVNRADKGKLLERIRTELSECENVQGYRLPSSVDKLYDDLSVYDYNKTFDRDDYEKYRDEVLDKEEDINVNSRKMYSLVYHRIEDIAPMYEFFDHDDHRFSCSLKFTKESRLKYIKGLPKPRIFINSFDKIIEFMKEHFIRAEYIIMDGDTAVMAA